MFAPSFFPGSYFGRSFYSGTVGNVTTTELLGAGYFSRSYFPGSFYSRSFFAGTGGNAAPAGLVQAEKRIEALLLGVWTDITDDTIGVFPIYFKYGIDGNSPIHHTASGGVLKWTLNNDVTNSAGIKGYYDPFSATKRPGWDFEIPVRVITTFAGFSRCKWWGKISDITSVMGEFEVTHCVALDIFDDFSIMEEPEVDLQIEKRSDEIMDTLFDAADIDVHRVFEAGIESYLVSMDGGTGQGLRLLERINQVNMSEWGYAYPVGSLNSDKPTVVLESRHHRASNPIVRFTLNAEDLLIADGYTLPGSSSDFYAEVRVQGHPVNDIVNTPVTVLYALQTTQTMVRSGETNYSLVGAYRDPISRDQIGGTEIIAPIPYNAGTGIGDYQMNTEPDGTGTDVTAYFTVVAHWTGIGVRFEVTNNGTETGYIIKLQIRGKPIFRYNFTSPASVPSTSLTTNRKKRVLEVDMPFQTNTNVTKDVADYLATTYGAPYPNLPPIRFLANRSLEHMTAALELEPGDRVRVNLPRLANREFTINQVELAFLLERQVYCTWTLESASSQRYWLMGVAGASEIGVTTFFGF